MGLSIIKRGGKSCPVLTCDSCGEPIEDLQLGIAQFSPTPNRATTEVHLYHKGKCDIWNGYWQPLSNYIPWLIWNHNLGIIEHTEKGNRLAIEVPEPLEV